MSKQDRQGVRTAAGLEQKYRFGKSISEQKEALSRQNLTLSQLVNYTDQTLDSFGSELESASAAIAEMKAQMSAIWDKVYPVGTIYFAYNHEDPATLFGGTWVRIENAFLWATSSNGVIGHTDGEYSHKLTIDEMPSHRHTINRMAKQTQTGTGYSRITSDGTELSYTNYEGGGKAHNNMPPYIEVSAWRRTA